MKQSLFANQANNSHKICSYYPQIVRLRLMLSNNTYPQDVFFDIETLINVAQPSSILLISDQSSDFLTPYMEQKKLLKQTCALKHIRTDNIDKITKVARHDVAIVLDAFEHLTKQSGFQLLSRLRDLLAHQYCIALPIDSQINPQNQSTWQLTDLFSFALERVAIYGACDEINQQQIGLFKYNINDYKKTPDWLNSDNWANPKMWEKYRW